MKPESSLTSTFQRIQAIYLNLYQSILIKIKNEVENYHKIKNIENDKLMIPTIKRAYNCMILHTACCALVFSVYVLLEGSNFNIIKYIISISIGAYCVFLVMFIRPFLNSALSKQNIIIAGIIFFIVNSLIPINTTIIFEYWLSENEFDKSIALCISFYWIVHFFNIIPGSLMYKYIMYILTIIILLGISKPKITLGFVALLANIFGHFIQIYLIWSKYHEESIILNNIETEKSMNNYLQSMNPQPIFTLNNNFVITRMNKRAMKLLENEKKDTFEEYAKELHTKTHINLLEYLKNINPNFDNIEFIKIKNWKKDKILVSSSQFNFGEEIHTLIIFQNITEIINIHEQEVSEKYQNLILFSASHEIRSNLNIIVGNLEQLIKRNDIKYIMIAKSASKIMESKLNLLMDYVQILNGKFQEHLSRFPLRTMIDEIVDIIQLFGCEKNLKVLQKYKANFDEFVECDRERIYSILIHTALNSVKFTLKGTIFIKAYIKNDFLNVVIKDTGIGMNESFVNQINTFASFDTVVNYPNSDFSFDQNNQNRFLTGLGLTSSSLICKMLGGSLNTKSVKDVGTTFNIRIKCKKIRNLDSGIIDDSCIESLITPIEFDQNYQKYFAKEGKPPEEFLLSTPRNLSTLLVLIVDDQSFNRNVLNGMLGSLQINKIMEAENGQQAVNICNENIANFDQITVFMDIEMPIMDGIESTRIIKSKDPTNKIKIIMLSAFNSEDIISNSFSAGANEFCVKPISFKRLKEYKIEKIFLF